MKIKKQIATQRQRRKFRVRNRIRKFAAGRPRVSVFRSNKFIYAQIIDDEQQRTLVSAYSGESELRGEGKTGGNTDAAARVGRVLAERALEKGIKKVAFDRGAASFHGRIAALANGAREGGLEF